MNQKQSGRQRGIILSGSGRQRLHEAIRQVAAVKNQGRPYTAKELSQQVGLSEATLSRMWAGKFGVDRRSLQIFFNAFGLTLTDDDYSLPSARQRQLPLQELGLGDAHSPADAGEIAYPGGPLPLGSPFYIPRPPIEDQACRAIAYPGGMLRIKGPSGFGKSSLLLRVMAHAQQMGYIIATLDLKQADPAILADAKAFLLWFCQMLCLKLDKPANLDDYWNDILGNALSATVFMREHILESIACPVVLNIQELNRLFAYSATAQAFLPLLRSWYEEARQDQGWQRLRQVVSYATDSYLPLDIHQSPFNVGLPLFLPELTLAQVCTLVKRYDLDLSEADCDRVFALVGGHPRLVNLAFYHLTQSDLTVDELIQTAAHTRGIFHPYLQRLLVNVQNGPEQMAQIKTLVISQDPIYLDPMLAYQLEAAGLVYATPDGWLMRLTLYRDYLYQTLF